MSQTFRALRLLPGRLSRQACRDAWSSRRAASAAASGSELAQAEQKAVDRAFSRDLWALDGPSLFRSGRFGNLFRILEDDFRDLRSFWDESFPAASRTSTFGAADVQELEKAFQITMDLPGIQKENIKVQVQEGILTISGQRKSSLSSQSPSGFHRQERSVGTFQRQFRLPASADPAAITAKAENGTLVVEVPKLESEVNPSTNIEVA